VLPHVLYIGTESAPPEPTFGAILAPVKRGSLEYWEWFYDPPVSDQSAIEERWDPELVMHQRTDLPDTAGTFHGYEGLKRANRELIESYEDIRWHPRESHLLEDGRWLVLLKVSGRGRGSGIELEGEAGHLITFEGDRVKQMDVYGTWESAREAVGLS
jgi:hypothetical protein